MRVLKINSIIFFIFELDDNLDVLKEIISNISKILIMLFEKGLINENDVEKYFKSNEIDIALENFINKQNKN